jgi:hypothetical protein
MKSVDFVLVKKCHVLWSPDVYNLDDGYTLLDHIVSQMNSVHIFKRKNVVNYSPTYAKRLFSRLNFSSQEFTCSTLYHATYMTFLHSFKSPTKISISLNLNMSAENRNYA